MALQLVCTKRSDNMGYVVQLTDLKEVDGKHYAIAVDIFDTRTDDILRAFMSTLSIYDSVTLITFGDHIERVHFHMSEYCPGIVTDMLRRREYGCNIAMALLEMDKIECDVRVLISSGSFNDGPTIVHLENNTLRISPGPPSFPEMTYDGVRRYHKHADLVYDYESQVPVRKMIRDLLKKELPSFYNIQLQGSFGKHYVKPLAYGGRATVHLPNFEGSILLSYLDSQGISYNNEVKINTEQ